MFYISIANNEIITSKTLLFDDGNWFSRVKTCALWCGVTDNVYPAKCIAQVVIYSPQSGLQTMLHCVCGGSGHFMPRMRGLWFVYLFS